MDSREHLRGSARDERVQVGADRGRDEGRRQPIEVDYMQPAFPDEVDGQKRKHEQTEVALVKLHSLAEKFEAEELRHFDRQRRGDR